MNKFYMGIAEECAKMSRAVRLQVGCVIVKNNNILSFSWNGMPTGWDNDCETKEYTRDGASMWLEMESLEEQYPFKDDTGRYRLVTKPEVLHAEANALMKLARSPESGDGSSMFVTHQPCLHCAKMIYQAGVTNLYFKHKYRKEDGIEFLQKCGVSVKEINN